MSEVNSSAECLVEQYGISRLNFESAKNILHINEFLDFIIGTQLLLYTFEERVEATSFFEAKRELETQCLGNPDELSQLMDQIRAISGLVPCQA